MPEFEWGESKYVTLLASDKVKTEEEALANQESFAGSLSPLLGYDMSNWFYAPTQAGRLAGLRSSFFHLAYVSILEYLFMTNLLVNLIKLKDGY